MRQRNLLCALAAAAAVVACNATTELNNNFEATLSGANERPPVESSGSGSFTANLTFDNQLNYTVNYSGTNSAVTMAHIHGPADAETNAGILVDLEAPPAGSTGSFQVGGTSGIGSGSLNLNAAVTATVSGDSLRRLLNAGLLYVNVHTVAHPGGELRGQIERQ